MKQKQKTILIIVGALLFASVAVALVAVFFFQNDKNSDPANTSKVGALSIVVNEGLFATETTDQFSTTLYIGRKEIDKSSPTPQEGITIRVIQEDEKSLLVDPSNTKITIANQLNGYSYILGNALDTSFYAKLADISDDHSKENLDSYKKSKVELLSSYMEVTESEQIAIGGSQSFRALFTLKDGSRVSFQKLHALNGLTYEIWKRSAVESDDAIESSYESMRLQV